MNKILNNYLYNLLYQLVVLLAPIITAPYLARVLGATNQGIYSYIYSATSILNTITILGTYNYGNRQIAYDRDEKDKLNETFWEIVFIRIILGMIGSIIYFIICFNSEYRVYFLFYYPWLLASYIDTSWLFIGVENMKPTAMKCFYAKIISVIGIFLFVRTNDDIGIYILVMSSTTLLSNISLLFQIKDYIKKPKIKFQYLLTHIKGSLVLLLPQMATMLYLQLDKVMIEKITGMTSQVAFYDNAEKIVTIPLTFITVMSTVLMPRIANEFKKGNKEKIRNLLIKAGDISLFFAFPMMMGLVVIAKGFVPWYLGNQFIPVSLGIVIISPIIVSNSLTGISGSQYFTATNQISILLKSYIVAAIANIIVNLILIPNFGFVGAAIATVISSYFNVLIQYYYLNKQINISSLLKKAFKYFLLSVSMAFFVIILTMKIDSSILLTLFQALIGITIYMLLSYVFKVKILREIINTSILHLNSTFSVEK